MRNSVGSSAATYDPRDVCPIFRDGRRSYRLHCTNYPGALAVPGKTTTRYFEYRGDFKFHLDRCRSARAWLEHSQTLVSHLRTRTLLSSFLEDSFSPYGLYSLGISLGIKVEL